MRLSAFCWGTKGFLFRSQSESKPTSLFAGEKRPCAMLTNVDPYLPGVVVLLGLPFVSWFPAHELDGHAPCVQLRGWPIHFSIVVVRRQF